MVTLPKSLVRVPILTLVALFINRRELNLPLTVQA